MVEVFNMNYRMDWQATFNHLSGRKNEEECFKIMSVCVCAIMGIGYMASKWVVLAAHLTKSAI